MRSSGSPGWRLDLAWSLLLSVVILGPLLTSTGYVLHGDLVFVPSQPWKPAWLGLDGLVPRAVPMDALVSAASHVAPGWLLQRIALLGSLVLAGTGAGRLVADQHWLARLAAISLFVWNPWVHERLGIGQWALLAGYACLPWTVRAAVRFRDDARAWAPLAIWLTAAAVCGPTAGVLAVGVAGAVVAWAGTRRTIAVAVLGLVANLPWLVPSVLLPGGLRPTDASYAAFAPSAESGAGVLGSLLSLGGIWKTSVLPAERSSVVIVALAGLLTVVAMLGWRSAAREDRRLVVSLAGTGTAALLLAWSTTWPAVQDGLDSMSANVPGLALFRDSHRLLALLAVALVPGVAAAVTALRARATPGREAVLALAGLAVVAPAALLPTLTWGLLGDLHPTPWPDSWHEVADRIDEGDRTVVLPWTGSYRGFAWNDHQAALDPAPRVLPGEVLIDDRVLLGDHTIGSESTELTRIGEALAGADPARALRALGVRWVLVEHGTGDVGAVPPGTVVWSDSELTLVDLGEPASYQPERPPRWAVVGGDLITIGVLVAGYFRHYRRVR